jgi:hypothetical protein
MQELDPEFRTVEGQTTDALSNALLTAFRAKHPRKTTEHLLELVDQKMQGRVRADQVQNRTSIKHSQSRTKQI